MSKKILPVILTIIFCTFGFLTSCDEKVTEPQSEISSQTIDSSLEFSDEISEKPTSSDSTFSSSSEKSEEKSQSSIESTPSKTSSKASSATPSKASSAQSSSSASSTVKPKNYFLAGSWNGYLVNDDNFLMERVEGTDNWYTATVTLTKENYDKVYEGHWYKVTEGNWTYSYGTDYYISQPAPVKNDDSGNPIGMGSIWVIDENITLTVMFDAENKVIYDNCNGKTLPTP